MSKPTTQMHNAFDPADAGALSERDRILVERRRALLGPAYRLFYREPVHVVRAAGVRLWDPEGNEYLDCYNNVPSVGHCHPKVVAAIAAQAARLNTHTRYLDEAILDYSERLLATFPAEIGRVMYTCTGSEAVDLALRISHHHTRGSGVVITENAYHGTTAATAAISPSLGPAVPLGAHVVTVPAPDRYRRRIDGDLGAVFAADVARAIAFLERHGIRFSAFIADGIFSTDGVFADPAGFLKPVVDVVHAAGGVYVADEVQPGFGRTGAAMWGFQRHGIVPDLVVMGKPMGNGMPIAAVAMKPEVVERFGNEVRYFNTFGANHVSIAAAAAVLEVIGEEKLMENAAAVGAHMIAGMRRLGERHPGIGDVRGAGLFLGLEFVSDRDRRTPDPARAQAVVDALRARRILISASGSHGQVLKIRPPLPFSKADADLFLGALGEVLDELDRRG
jgi:4-aminobutyrate aminotransferase-like enzyme